MELKPLDVLCQAVWHLAQCWDDLRELEHQTGKQWDVDEIGNLAGDLKIPANLGDAHRLVTQEIFDELLQRLPSLDED
jgi:hypothetical protein